MSNATCPSSRSLTVTTRAPMTASSIHSYGCKDAPGRHGNTSPATALGGPRRSLTGRQSYWSSWALMSRTPKRPRAAAPRPRPDRPGVRAAVGRRGARPRREHVGRAPQPRVPARVRRVAVRLFDDAAHRARDGVVASWRPQRHRGLFRGRLGVAGQLQQSLHRAGRCAAQRLPAPRGARDGGHVVVRGETGDPTDQESRSAGHGAAPSVTAWTSPFTRASSRITIRTPPWPFTAAPWA